MSRSQIEEADDGSPSHLFHLLAGTLTILLSNGLVIIGIIWDIHFLLIPWLLIYLIGKLDQDKGLLAVIALIKLLDIHTIDGSNNWVYITVYPIVGL